jgi:exonuclease V gamma subunit
MERWLSQQLAGHFKVWGNYQFLFPGKFFSSLAQKIDSRLNDTASDRNLMLWRIEALLRRLDSDDFLPLKQYLSGENSSLKRYQLARQLAQIFDQYQIMRPDMLTSWQYADLKGKDFICAWLHHLIINQVLEQTTFLLSTDEDLILLPDYCRPNPLSAFLDIYRAGNNAPNAFFVEAALTYVKHTYKLENGNRASKSALDAAIEELSRAVQQPYEPELKRLYQNVTMLTEVLDETFEQYCRMLLQPAWNATHKSP